jgi:hypothetical protein
VLDIFQSVAKEISGTSPARRRTIPLWGKQYDWWPEAVRKRIAELRIDQKMLAEWIDADPPEVNKCITRKVPVYDLLLDISDALDLPYPVVLPESYEEALIVARERRLARRMTQADDVKAGAANSRRRRQIMPISLADVSKWKSGQDSAQEHREKPQRAQRATR